MANKDGERLATLEERRKSQDMFNEYVVKKFDKLEQTISGEGGIDEKLDTVIQTLSRQKGFIAGIVAAVTTLFSVVGIATDWYINHTGGHTP